MNVYFDSAATTRLRPEVISKMTEALLAYGNPSSTHAFGRTAKALIENARKSIAKQLHVSASEIIFTSGGTEADNLAIHSAIRDCNVERIITSKIEHHAVLHTVQYYESQGIQVDYVILKDCGTPDEKHLERLLETSNKKTLVSLMHVNNEVGNMIDVKAIATLIKSHNGLFHCDMVQSIGHFEMDFQEIPVDFTAASAHKFHGPKGVGFAFVRKGSGIGSMIMGGSQERGLRAGTESVHNIVGLEESLNISYNNLQEEKAYITGLKAYMIKQLQEKIPAATLNGNCGNLDKSTYTLLNVCIPCTPQKAMLLLFNLDLKGIACSKGSACQSGSQLGSHVLSQMLSEEDLAKPSLRFSFSKFNTKEEIDYVVDTLVELIA